ncbi:MAG TPA: HYR domain-containing protein, partial [Woeseiaceae bacterium]|nr:HYR domain-containing protein [Woeseiaceae bacterium]
MKSKENFRTTVGSISYALVLSLLMCGPTTAQVIEGNVNVTGAPAPGYDNGQLGRQENEPSCAIDPLNELHIACAFNWYGFSDQPEKQGETWIAFSETTDGRHFIRRPLTGTKLNFPLHREFAADPTVLVAPGWAAVTSIVGDRNGNSVMVIQRMLELNREDGFRYVSEAGQVVVSVVSGSRFIDKPDSYVLIDPNGGTRSVTMTLEETDENGDPLVVTREIPNFRIVVTYADFNASDQNIRTWSTFSDDFGAAGSWSNPRQISNTSGLDQGLSLASKGNDVLYTFRRFDSGEGSSAIMGALSRDRSSRIGKVFKITDVCEFDQFTAPNAANPDRASARSNMFPWVSATGSHFVLAYVERPRDAQGNCLTDYSNVAGTRVMIRTSANGTSWSAPVPVVPFAGQPVHFQFMPTLACARGACNVLYYSTLRESQAYSELLQDANTRHWEINPFIEDFNVNDGPDGLGLLRYRRNVDVFSSKINIAGNGTPAPSVPELVSQYQVDYDEEGNAFERESNPLNVRNYGGNTVAFAGDYNALAAQEWRWNAGTGKWEANAAPIGNVSDPINRASYFAAWTDNRRIRGFLYDDQFFDGTSTAPLPYELVEDNSLVRNDAADAATVPEPTSPGMSDRPLERVVTETDVRYVDAKLAAAQRPDRFRSAYTLAAVTETDPNPGAMTCSPAIAPTHPTAEYQTRIKDSEIYGATIEDRVRLVAPTVAKNFGQIQRGFVIGSQNTDAANAKTLRLVIGNQPGQAPVTNPVPVVLTTARASWRQLPFGPTFVANPTPPLLGDPLPVIEEFVTIQPLSTEYVTLFVVSQNLKAPVTVYAFDGPTLVSQITVNGDTEAGTLIDPGTTPQNVLLFEIHDPDLIEPIWTDLEVNALNPNYQNPNLRNPNLKNPNWKNTDYMDPNLKNPNLKNPNFRNTTEEATNLQNPNLKNPNLRNEAIVDSFIDVTYTVVSQNNTTTAINADFAYGGEELQDLDVEVIAWQADELDSLQDCETGLITESKVIAARSNPNLRNLAPADIADPFQGFVTFPLAPRGEIHVTVRIFCSEASGECSDLIETDEDGESKLSQLLGYNFWAQKANTGKFEINTLNEQVIKDVIPPVFNVENGYTFVAQALDQNGAFVDLVGDMLIAADDNGTPADVSCSLDLAGDPSLPGTVPVGTTGASCTTADGIGNVGTWTGSIRVEDNTLPILTIPAATLTRQPTAANGANVDYLAADAFGPGLTITATDAIDPAVALNCTPASGSLFPIGNTLVTCTASDDGPNSSGGVNSVQGSFTIVIVDSTPPVITAPADILAFEATGAGPLTIVPLGDATASDSAGDPVITNDAPANGFPLGTTIVTWTATDLGGNQATATQNVTVVDTTAPVITVPADITKTSNSTSGTAVSFNVTATDKFPVTISCVNQANGAPLQSGDNFQVGDTTVACTATDTSGNSGSD